MVNEMLKTENRPHRTLKWILGAVALVAVVAVGWMASKNSTLLSASLTGGGAQSVTEILYIPNNYSAAPGDSGQIELRAGIAMTNMTALDLTFAYDPSKMAITGHMTSAGDALAEKTPTTVTNNPSGGTYRIAYSAMSPSVDNIAKDAVLLRLQVSILNSATGTIEVWGQTMSITAKDNTPPSTLPLPAVTTPPTLRRGSIILSGTASACTAQTCNAPNGACSLTLPVSCVCITGYKAPFCAECDVGYTGYPDCKKDVTSNVSNLILTLAPDAIGKLTVDENRKAFSTAFVIFKSVVTDFSKKIRINGVDYDVGCTSTAVTDLEKLTECTTAFAGNMADSDPLIGPGLRASVFNGMPGVVKLEASGAIEDLVGIQSTAAQVLVVPGMADTVVLDSRSSYQTRVIGFEVDGTNYPIVKELLFTEATLVPQPVNRLKSSGLTSGLLERGDAPGAGTVFAQIKKADDSLINSNSIAFDVAAGPVVEYTRIIGAGSLERGARANLSVKVSDMDTISDITDIRSSIVRSTLSTYDAIEADANAVWFTATPFVDEVTVTENSPAPAQGAPAVPVYRIYRIPVEIPQDPLMVDGAYKLVLAVTDAVGHEYATVLPISIGRAATGDVSGDGTINMIDVLLAFQISNQRMAATPAQTQAADMDGNGTVNMLDVVTLFNQVSGR